MSLALLDGPSARSNFSVRRGTGEDKNVLGHSATQRELTVHTPEQVQEARSATSARALSNLRPVLDGLLKFLEQTFIYGQHLGDKEGYVEGSLVALLRPWDERGLLPKAAQKIAHEVAEQVPNITRWLNAYNNQPHCRNGAASHAADSNNQFQTESAAATELEVLLAGPDPRTLAVAIQRFTRELYSRGAQGLANLITTKLERSNGVAFSPSVGIDIADNYLLDT